MSAAAVSGLKSFTAAERFLAEVSGDARRAGYVLLGDEAFLYELCRKGVLKTLVPDDLREFCLHDLDLATTSIFDALDRAQTPSLMAPFQVIFVRNVRQLYTRGAEEGRVCRDGALFPSPNPQALLLFVADSCASLGLRAHGHDDKERFERLTKLWASTAAW